MRLWQDYWQNLQAPAVWSLEKGFWDGRKKPSLCRAFGTIARWLALLQAPCGVLRVSMPGCRRGGAAAMDELSAGAAVGGTRRWGYVV